MESLGWELEWEDESPSSQQRARPGQPLVLCLRLLGVLVPRIEDSGGMSAGMGGGWSAVSECLQTMHLSSVPTLEALSRS